MVDTIKLATARELAATDSVRETTLMGGSGGYTVTFTLDSIERTLAAKDGTPRLFSGVEAAARVLARLGIRCYRVNGHALATESSRRPRPDRALALRRLHEDSAYLASIRAAVAESRADPTPPLSSTDAQQHMARLKARLSSELSAAIQGPARRK